MRFMIMVKATKDTEAGKFPDNAEKLFEAMAAYHDELVKAGVLLDAAGLQPSSAGWKIKYRGDKRSVVDGPFTEAKEMIAGYTLIQTKTREEALEWTRRFPKPHFDHECEIEVRQLYELDDFATLEAAKDSIDKFRTMEKHGPTN
ncbi:YciI family protein [Dongia sp. agr-C8]